MCLPVCGDGIIISPKEECDDQNTKDLDGCNSSCKIEIGYICAAVPSKCESNCGDTVKASNEECDLLSQGCINCKIVNGWECRPLNCIEKCNDGLVVGKEVCDAG